MGLTSDELVGVALEIEKHGEALYRQLAQRFTDPNIKKTFEYLASEEAEHRKTFEKMLAGGLLPLYPTLEQGEEDYIRSLVQSQFILAFIKTDVLIMDIKSASDAVALGLRMEKETLLFFESISSSLGGEASKIFIDILAEEKKHFVRLSALARDMNAPKGKDW
ncbi:MAG: ferritin family protein [Candidatus Thermoplasmatota archaeon]|nr:ferritin family protein [Candidatus Thermoplasmatota archaeon]